MRRTGGVLQAERHVHGALDLRGEVLDVEVAQHRHELLPGNAFRIGRVEDLVHRPPDDARIVRIVPQERHTGSDGLHAGIPRRRHEGEGSALAFAGHQNVASIGLGQRFHEVDGPPHVTEGAAVVEAFLALQSPVDPPFLIALEDALVPDAHQEVDALRRRRRVEVKRFRPIAHVLHPDGVLALRHGDGDDAAGNSPAPGSIPDLVAGAERIGVFRNLRPDGFQRHFRQLRVGLFPEGVEVWLRIRQAHHFVGPHADVPADAVPQAHLVKTGFQAAEPDGDRTVLLNGNLLGQKYLRRIFHELDVRHQLQRGGAGCSRYVRVQSVRSLVQEQPAQVWNGSAGGRGNLGGAGGPGEGQHCQQCLGIHRPKDKQFSAKYFSSFSKNSIFAQTIEAMKHILVCSLALVAVLSCGSPNSRRGQQASGEMAGFMETEMVAESPVMALFEAAPTNLAEDIVRQLPPELLPEPNSEGQDGVTQLLRSTDTSAPGHIDWEAFFGECDVVGINTHAFPRADGSWLFTYVEGAGCDCYVQDEPMAFNYADGKLTLCPWPFKEPEYKDFVNPLVEGLVDAKQLAWIKDDWSIHYDFGDEAPNEMTATFLNIDYYNFTAGCRPIHYVWDGSEFHRTDGRFGLIRENGFAQFSPYGYVEDIPEGFEVKGKGRHRSLLDKKTGETVCNFLIDADDAILEIEVVAPLSEKEHKLYPGELLAEIDQNWSDWNFTESDARLRPSGDVVISFIGSKLVVDAQDIEGEPEGADDIYPQWSYKPGACVKAILID